MGKSDVTIRILGDSSGAQKAFASVHSAGEGFGSKMASVFGALQLDRVADAAVNWAKGALSGASDLNESVSKAQTVFGDYFAGVQKLGDSAARSMGQTKQQAIEAAGTFGNLLKAAGLSGAKTEEISVGFTKLASDLASFNNTSVDDALLALRSGLVGESEPLKRFGVNMNEATLKAKALELGLVKASVNMNEVRGKTLAVQKAQEAFNEAVKKFGPNSAQASEAQVRLGRANDALEKEMSGKIPAALDASTKAQAAYALVMDQTKLAQGDFARTSDGAANKQRILAARMGDLQTQIGQKLLPVFNKALETGLKIVDWIGKKWPGAQKELQPWLEKLGHIAGTIGEKLQRLGDFLSKNQDVIRAAAIGIAVALVPGFIAWAVAAGAAAIATLAAAAPVIALGLVVGAAAYLIIHHWDDIKAGLRVLGDFFGNVLGWIGDKFSAVFGFLMDVVKGYMGFWKAVFIDPLVATFKFLVGVGSWVFEQWKRFLFDPVVGAVQWIIGAFQSVAGFVGDAFSKALQLAKAPINALIGLINLVIGGINKIQVDIPGWVPGLGGKHFGFNLPEIPKLASGGVVTRPTLALVGEAGPEAIVPLSRAGAAGGVGGSTVQVNITVEGSVIAERDLVRSVKAELERYFGGGGGLSDGRGRTLRPTGGG